MAAAAVPYRLGTTPRYGDALMIADLTRAAESSLWSLWCCSLTASPFRSRHHAVPAARRRTPIAYRRATFLIALDAPYQRRPIALSTRPHH